jgi:hypothetical protein
MQHEQLKYPGLGQKELKGIRLVLPKEKERLEVEASERREEQGTRTNLMMSA